MDSGTLGAAMEREHHEIDRGIEAFGAADTDASAALTAAIAALRRHIYLEEEFLFPPMQDELAIPIGVMLREHGELWRTLEALEAKAGDADAAAICERLLAQLELHNSKEEPIFYARADASLGPEATAELKTFLDTGQMPAGWTCRQA